MGVGRWTRAGVVEPVGFNASQPFGKTFDFPDGVLVRLLLALRGTTVGTTGVNTDSPERIVSAFQLLFPRTGMRSYLMSGPLKVLRNYATYLNAYVPQRGASGAAAAQFTFVDLPLGVPYRDAQHRWGIDRRELSGRVELTGQWGALLDYGAGTTAFNAAELEINCYVESQPADVERAALLPVYTRIPMSDETTLFNKEIQRGHLDGLFGLYGQVEDASAPTADRVEGLISQLGLSHGSRGALLDSTSRWTTLKQAGLRYFGVTEGARDAAMPAGLVGTVFYVANEDLLLEGYADLAASDLDATIDPTTAPPAEIANVVPAAGDAFHALVAGVQYSPRLLARLVSKAG